MIQFLCHELVYSATFCYLSRDRERESIGYREIVRPTAAWKCEWNFPLNCSSKRPSSGKIQFAGRAKRRLMYGLQDREKICTLFIVSLVFSLKGGVYSALLVDVTPLHLSWARKKHASATSYIWYPELTARTDQQASISAVQSYVHNSVRLTAIFVACLSLKVSGKIKSVMDVDCIYERQL